MNDDQSRLPIDAVLGPLAQALEENTSCVLVAPPGAGKTTRVPLVLRQQSWAKRGKIIVLEPRRLAARAAAQRLASNLGERIGETIGLRVRLQSITGANNRIEVVTEGVFTRMILEDPALEDVAAVVFDEFHERSLDADLGLALALEVQQDLREDLRILVMSATLDGARVARLMGDAPVIESEGRAFPVETIYCGRDRTLRIEDNIAQIVVRAINNEPGSLLVFLPGQREILRTANLLRERIQDSAVTIAPLYGAMDRVAQDTAIAPAPRGNRKIVLATAIAETSLTIEDVRVVIDSGLARVPRYEPGIGLTRLETIRASKASADQRRGRAGRTMPGVCYRLWEEAATKALEPFTKPEILAADLSSLMLDLADWGVRDPDQLSWIDMPPRPAVQEARKQLTGLGALDEVGAITGLGRLIRMLPLPPRLAKMVIEAARHGAASKAARLACLLTERGLGGVSIDLAERLERFARERSGRAKQLRELADRWAQQASKAIKTDQKTPRQSPASQQDISAGAMLAHAYPDRIARSRGAAGSFLMANGRAARCEPQELLARARFLVIADVSGTAANSKILAAAQIDEGEVLEIVGDFTDEREETTFDRASGSIKRRQIRRYGAISLSEHPLPIEGPEAAAVLADGIASLGINRLPWSKTQIQIRERAAYTRASDTINDWPDLSDAALAKNAADWLAPYIEGRSSLASITADDLGQALATLLPWPLQQKLEEHAPTHFETPAGSTIALDYGVEGGPVLRVRVQELFGLNVHPSIAGGRIPLTLELLSPAQRPIQITRDLPGFWKGSWSAVKAEMKGRYPKHAWPDDPTAAVATRRATPRR